MNSRACRALIVCLLALPSTLSAESLNSLAETTLLFEKGDRTIALNTALYTIEIVESNPARVHAHLLAAQIALQLGDDGKSDHHVLKAERLLENSGTSNVRINNIRGGIASIRGEYSDAANYYRSAISHLPDTDIGSRSHQLLLLNLLSALIDSDDVDTEVHQNLASLAAFVEAEKLPVSNNVLVGLALSQQRVDADGYAERSSALLNMAASRAQTNRERSLAYGYQGLVYKNRLQPTDAAKLTELALVLAQRDDLPDLEFIWTTQLGAIMLAEGQTIKAARAFSTAITILARVRADLPVLSPKGFAELIFPTYYGHADALLQLASLAEADSKQALLRTAVDTLEALKKAEVEDYFSTQCLVQQKVDRSSLLLGTAIIYPVLLDSRTEIILETEEGLQQFTLPVGRKAVTDRVTLFRLSLEEWEDLTDDVLIHAVVLYDWLIRPIEPVLKRLNTKTVVVIPDGPLRTIPMSPLFDGERYLVEKYALATAPSLQLVDLRQATGQQSLVGGISAGVQGFSPLMNVRRELDAVSGLLTADKLQDQEFQLADVIRRFAEEDFRVVHFATHGEFSSDFRKSFILTYDDKLTMAGLERSLGEQKNLDLLVLSACRTAAGDERAALGLAGVAVQAGARSALATLWPVSDDGTATMIQDFYQFLRVEGLTKAESLRRAQINLLRDPVYSHPTFWAPYLLVGNWN